MLELQGDASGLLDDPLLLRVRGLGDLAEEGTVPLWRARVRDDDDRVWRAVADRPQDLPAAFAPAKPAAAGALAALQSLRPLRIDVRVEAPDDGRAANRTLTRLLVGDGVRIRRWRGVLPGAALATLHLPAGDGPPCAAVVLDATAGATEAAVAALAAPLLASRGVLALTVSLGGRGGAAGTAGDSSPAARAATAARDDLLALAAERLAAVPGAAEVPQVTTIAPLLPPGVPAREPADGVAWDALLAQLGAHPRMRA